MDFNVFVDEFASLVATKVVQELRRDQLRGGWPETEVKELPKPRVAPWEDLPEDVAADVESPEDIPTPAPKPVALANSSMDRRRDELSKVNIRTLRNKIAAAEEKEASDYSHLSKEELVNVIVKFETLVGRTVDEEILRLQIAAGKRAEVPDVVEDDNDFSEKEPEDDEEVGPLTREQAENLDLKELKALAIDQGLTDDDLRGLDVMAVVDLLFASKLEAVADDIPDDEEGDFPSPDEIKKMSIGEVKELIAILNDDYDAGLEYDRSASRGDLIDLIFENVEFE